MAFFLHDQLIYVLPPLHLPPDPLIPVLPPLLSFFVTRQIGGAYPCPSTRVFFLYDPPILQSISRRSFSPFPPPTRPPSVRRLESEFGTEFPIRFGRERRSEWDFPPNQ